MNIWRYSCNLTKQCRILIIFLLFHSIAYSQDSISVLGECSQAELAVNEEYLFELISSEEGAETASWSIQKDGIDYSEFFVISGVGKSVSIKGSSSVLGLVIDNSFEVKATYDLKFKQTSIGVQYKKNLTPDPLRITSDNGVPLLNTNVSATINIKPGDIVKFKVHLAEIRNSDIVTWSVGTPSTFNGLTVMSDDNLELTYHGISQKNPELTSGYDKFEVTDGMSTIEIIIIISPPIDEPMHCDNTKELSITPNDDKKNIVAPMESIRFFAKGGTCNFTWALVTNNSGGMLIRRNNSVADFLAGTINNSVDVFELSDGVSFKRVEVLVTNERLSGSGGNGCFIRNKNSQRD